MSKTMVDASKFDSLANFETFERRRTNNIGNIGNISCDWKSVQSKPTGVDGVRAGAGGECLVRLGWAGVGI